MNQEKKEKQLKHLKIYEQFFDSDYEDGDVAVATAFSVETEEFMAMGPNESADYSAVFTNEDGEYVTVELTRSIEPISEEGMGKMMVIEGSSTDGREYSAVGTYEKQEDPLLGDLWSLKSISLETI